MGAIETQVLLASEIGAFYSDPLGYVLFNFPWGEKNTPLEGFSGPRDWQRGFLNEWGEEIRSRGFDGANAVMPIEFGTVSGHGTGKSCLSAFITKFIFDTRPYSRGTVTANTAPQLKTKTWAEVGKWHKLSLTRDWGIYSASQGNMSLKSIQDPENWFVNAFTCREENSEAFAGQHALNSTSWYLFDEASSVPDKIWEVSDGGMTDGEPMRFSFGNGTRGTGRFRTIFKNRSSIITKQIDSRDVEGTNKALFQEWIDMYGEDSDFVRVRVRGMFPRASSMQFFPEDLVDGAAKKQGESDLTDPLIMGVDVARYGDDQSVIRWRRGYDADVFPPLKFSGIDTMTLASIVNMHAIGSPHTKQMSTDAVFIDETGVGGGVIDRVLQLGLDIAVGVNFGEKPVGSIGMRSSDGEKYFNRRTEMYGALRGWLRQGGSIQDDNDLCNELTSLEYGFNNNGEIQLERKDDTKKRMGGNSPDDADALALTFAEPVMKKDVIHSIQSNTTIDDYDPYA